MCHLTGPLKTTALIVLAAGCTLAGTTIAGAAEDDSRAQRNAYVVAPLVSNVAGGAAVQDTVLHNAWGVAFSPAGSPFWVNDNGTGCSTLYSGAGTKLAPRYRSRYRAMSCLPPPAIRLIRTIRRI